MTPSPQYEMVRREKAIGILLYDLGKFGMRRRLDDTIARNYTGDESDEAGGPPA
jgi:hypothetical protein